MSKPRVGQPYQRPAPPPNSLFLAAAYATVRQGQIQVNDFPTQVVQKRQLESRSSQHLEFRTEFKLRGARIIKRGTFEPPFHSILSPTSTSLCVQCFRVSVTFRLLYNDFKPNLVYYQWSASPRLIIMTSKIYVGSVYLRTEQSNSSFFLGRKEAKLMHWLCSRSRVCRNLSWNTTDDALRQVSADYSRDQKMALCYVVSFVSE